jgi:hypothetical protein
MKNEAAANAECNGGISRVVVCRKSPDTCLLDMKMYSIVDENTACQHRACAGCFQPLSSQPWVSVGLLSSTYWACSPVVVPNKQITAARTRSSGGSMIACHTIKQSNLTSGVIQVHVTAEGGECVTRHGQLMDRAQVVHQLPNTSIP